MFHTITSSHEGFDWATEGCKLYAKRIQRYAKFTEHKMKRRKQGSHDFESIKKQDQIDIQSMIPKQSKLIICDERGKQYNSREFASFIEHQFIQQPSLTFLVGPAYGLSQDLLEQHSTIALSSMTLQHEFAALMLYEQIYRSLTILKNHPYHL